MAMKAALDVDNSHGDMSRDLLQTSLLQAEQPKAIECAA